MGGYIGESESSSSGSLRQMERELGVPLDGDDDDDDDDDANYGVWRDREEVLSEAEAAAEAAAAASWSGAWSAGGSDLYDAVARGEVDIVGMQAFEVGDVERLYRGGVLDEEDVEELWQLAAEETHYVFVKV